MPNNYLSVLYKHIIQVENENVGLKVGGTNIPLPPLPIKKWGGACIPCPPPPPRPASYASVCGGARCSSVVRAFAYVTVGRQIDPSWWTHLPISLSTTGVTMAVICFILSMLRVRL